MKKEKQLTSIEIAAKPRSYSLAFLPGAGVAATQDNVDRWRGFLDTLSAKTRVGEDLESGAVGILYREGVWLGDLVLADDVKSLAVIPDIHEVRGHLVARNVRVCNRFFTHPLRVAGNLVVHQDILRDSPPHVERGGLLALSWPRRVEELRASPQRLIAWGVGEDGAALRLNEGDFALAVEREDEAEVFLLRNVDNGQQYLWEFNAWEPVRGSGVEQEVLNQVTAKLERFCKLAGLGAGFVLRNTKKIGHNIRKICRYLEFLGESVIGEAPLLAEETGGILAEVGDLLRELEGVVYGPEADAPHILSLLDQLSDQLADKIFRLNALPRDKKSEGRLRNDLDFLNALLADAVTPDEMFRHTTRAVLFLSEALRSPEGQVALGRAVSGFVAAFETASRVLGLDETVSLAQALRHAADTLENFRTRALADGAGGPVAVDDLELELARLGETLPSKLFRQLQRLIREGGMGPEAEEDLRLLNDLERFQGPLDSLQRGADFLLDVILANFQSPALDSLQRVRRSLLSGAKDPDLGVQVILARLKSCQAVDFVRFLLRRVSWEYSVLRRFNETAGAPRRGREETGPARESGGLTPDLVSEVLMRLNRVCLFAGLGKAFLDQQGGALRRNLERLKYFIELCVTNSATPGGDSRTATCRALLADFAARLQALQIAVRDNDVNSVRAVLATMGENYLQAMRAALGVERSRLNTQDLSDDIQALERLQRQNLTRELLLGGTGETLAFLDAVLESRPCREELESLLRPLSEALAELRALEPDLGLTRRAVLLHFDVAVQPLARKASDRQTLEPAARLRDFLSRLETLSLPAVLGGIHRAASRAGDTLARRDAKLLERLLAFRQGGLDQLTLSAEQAVWLVTAHMVSFVVNEILELRRRREFSGKSPAAVLAFCLARLRWHDSVIQAYNVLARR